ncbi:MAG: PocR ligand-binding domain-containing protein [Mobilitalea sp.]
MKEWLKLDHVLNTEQWSALQESLAQVTGMAIIMVDYKGLPVTEHSNCQEFCRKIRKDPVLSQCCQKCDSRGGLEAVRTNNPYIYQCCFSIIDIAIPIIVDNTYLGAVMAGQVRLPDNQNTEMIEQIYVPVSINHKLITEKIKELNQDYENIPVLQYEQIESSAMMLFHLCNYLVKEADSKRQVIETYEAMFQKPDELSAVLRKETLYSASFTRKRRKSIADSSSSSASAKQMESLPNINSSNRIIMTAYDYILSHKEETISLKKMAEYCHVSSSYLSRLFTKEVGESYSIFIVKMKIDWAKEIIETTDYAISRISEALGFNDVGYFTKTFKKYVGLTPSFYRSYSKR